MGYTSDSLLWDQTNELEAALWTALRALEESAEMHRRLAERAAANNPHRIGRNNRHQAQLAEERASTLRKLLVADEQQLKRMPKAEPTRAHRDEKSFNNVNSKPGRKNGARNNGRRKSHARSH